MTLSWSRALYLEFFLDQTTENFLNGHARALAFFGGSPRILLHDNLKSAVLERRCPQVRFNPRLLELAAHYHFETRPCQIRAGNQKGRVERAIRYVRDSYWAGRVFTTLEDCNRQAARWRDEFAHRRPWPDDAARTWPRRWKKNGPVCCRCRSIPSTPSASLPCAPPRPSISASTSTTTPSRPRPVGRALILASETEVRLQDGTDLVARHRRSFDRG